MSNGSTEEWVAKLSDQLTEIKISSASVSQKLDVIQSGFEKIEKAMESLTSATAKQETRLTVLEQKVVEIQATHPQGLSEDVAIIKSQIAGYQKLMWVVSTSIIGLLIKTLYDAMSGV
jgi:predicted  nucleic acid-binding Zn-ribbon protein